MKRLLARCLSLLLLMPLAACADELLERLQRLAPWPVDWIDPAPAIARRVSALLGSPGRQSDAGAEMIFTSQRPHTLSGALMPFFGGRVPA